MSLISCIDLKIGYVYGHPINKVSLDINEGDFICIIGNNGTGKSTLVKTILKLIPSLSGRIIYNDALHKYTIGYLPQNSSINPDFPATVYEIVISGCLKGMHKKLFYTKKEKEIANRYLEKLGISHLKNKPFVRLSGGEQQRTLIARALCSTEKILFLDEPLQGLDSYASNNLYEILSDINKEFGVTIVMITHNIDNAIGHANKVVCLGHDETFVGTIEEYKVSPLFSEYQGGHDHA